MIDKYILDEKGKPVPEPNLFVWAKWFETANRVVAVDVIGNSKVSTVFLGLNHNYQPDGPPILWETLVIGGKLDQEIDRCSGNRKDAEKMHAKMVKKVKKLEP